MFRGQLLAQGISPFLCSMGMWDNWMGQSDKAPAPAPNNANGSGQNPQDGADNDTNTDPNTDNNTGTNDALIAQLWDEAKQPPKAGDPPPANPGGNPPAAPVQKTDEQMRAEIATHLGTVGLGNLELSAADVEKLNSGENTHQEFANLVNTRIQQAYLQSIQTGQKLFTQILEQKLPEMVKQAVDQSKSFFEGDRLRSVLRTDDFLKGLMDDPSSSPVVETVMRQFITKGANKDKATQLTREYFQRMRKAMDPDYVPPSTNTRTTFRGNPRTAGNINFVDVLKGK